MIKVAFLFNFQKEYKGGINYLRNLFYALNQKQESSIQIFLFVPDNLETEYIDIFSPFVTIVRVKALVKWHPYWLVDKLLGKILNYTPCIISILKRRNIDVVSHSNFYSKGHSFSLINWIPDFQYLHYPDLWSSAEMTYITELHKHLVAASDKIVLSSNDAFNDFKKVHPEVSGKVEVIHFVSQPQRRLDQLELNRKNANIQKYIDDDIPYFYLPNQFWTHKNHLGAFKACKILADRGYKFQLLTSGYMKDFRGSNNHVEQLVDYVKINNLDQTIKFLGLIPYDDVFKLIINAAALINPSYFEGWSSTVEEAKTVGTLTLLSDIPVHREQNPLNAKYFDPGNPNQLAQLMEEILTNKISYTRPGMLFLQKQLENRTLAFGEKYGRLVNEIVRHN